MFDWLKETLPSFAKLLKMKQEKGICVSTASTEPVTRAREPKDEELTLGWAQGYDEETDENVVVLKGMSQKDRNTHFYVIGSSGFGKSKFLEHLIIQDIERGKGFGVIDPHGDLVENIKGWLYLASRSLDIDLQKDIVLIEPTKNNKTVSFNPLEITGNMLPEAQAKELEGVFKKIWADAWGDRMASILRNSFIALIENKLTLAELPLLLTEKAVRQKILANVKNQTCLRRFKELDSQQPNIRRQWIESTLNKVDAFLSDPRIRQIVCQPKSTFNLREIIDNQKIVLINLDKGHLKGGADLLGALLLSKIQMTAFTRTDIEQEDRIPFYLYIDEFQNFASENFIEALSEARKYGLFLLLAHQHLSQVPRIVQDSILTNCGVQVCFQISRNDASIMAKELLTPLYTQPPGWEITIQLLQDMEKRMCFIKSKEHSSVIAVRVPQTPNPCKANDELDGTTRAEFNAGLLEANIGKKYLKSRKSVEQKYTERTEQLTAEAVEPESFREAKQARRKKIVR